MKRICLAVVLPIIYGCSANPVRTPSEEAEAARSSLEEACATVYPDCRRNLTFKLNTPDEGVKETHFKVSYPPVQNGEVVTIFPGETLFVEGEWVDGRLTNLKSVPEVKNHDRTLTFQFEQMEAKVDMMLTVSNASERMIKYRLGMQRLDNDGIFKTSSCPVIPGGHAFEHWPHPIFQLVIMDIQEIADKSSMKCE